VQANAAVAAGEFRGEREAESRKPKAESRKRKAESGKREAEGGKRMRAAMERTKFEGDRSAAASLAGLAAGRSSTESRGFLNLHSKGGWIRLSLTQQETCNEPSD
jgi:hypothetical protein